MKHAMEHAMTSGLLQRKDGQAATEFVVAAAFLLVPLFLIVPLLGKYIDIKQAAIQQARFTAWEYTVWAGDDEDIMAGIDAAQSAGVKPYKTTLEQGADYFLTDPTAAAYGTSSVARTVNPLWQDHRRVPLLRMTDVASAVKEGRTPVPAGIIGETAETLFQFLGDVVSLFGRLLRLLGVDAQFDAINTKGHFTADVKATVRSLDQVLPDTGLAPRHAAAAGTPLVIQAKAGVLSNNWNAGSRKNATAESRGLVVTSLLSPITKPINKVIGGINRLLGKIPLLKVKLPALPEFGYVRDDLIPLEHLEGNQKKLEGKLGLYSYE